MNAPWKGELSVHLPPSHADGPANVITVTAFLCDETGHGIAATEYVGRAEDLAHRANAYPRLMEALEEIALGGEAERGTDPNFRARSEMAVIARAALSATREDR